MDVEIVMASGNKGKIKEAQDILKIRMLKRKS